MRTRFALPVVAFLMVCSPALAQVSQISSSSGLSAADTRFTVPSINVGRPIGSPGSFTTANNSLTFSAAGGILEVDTVGYNYGGSEFPNGTNIIYAGGFQGSTAPLTLSFTTPVSEFGFGSEEFNGGSYLINYLVNFTTNGIASSSVFSSAGSDSTAVAFIGARAVAGSAISSVVLSDLQGDNISAGPVSYANFSPATAVPELATWAMMIVGFGLIGGGDAAPADGHDAGISRGLIRA